MEGNRSDGREPVQVQLAVVQDPGAADLLQAHAVADHEDDIAHLIVHRRHHDVHDLVRIGRGIILQRLFFLLLLAGDSHRKGGQGQDGDSLHANFRK